MPTHLLVKMNIIKIISRLSLKKKKLNLAFSAGKGMFYHLNACGDFIYTHLGSNQVLL